MINDNYIYYILYNKSYFKIVESKDKSRNYNNFYFNDNVFSN